ncbi:hypothetical protein OBBRIDRAFT_839080 [Obba rivulosa]|uniref:Uncharacterized protein n=1 Tax=Obba rivulosa TaxID=1052685 RepID=A0A8E2DFU3_9APHY|nr:hypothetical protein OBBRIDRAFT_839080 [Obba rivulosa]
MLLGLKIAFSIIISGLIVISISLATFRRFTCLPNTALQGEAGQRTWTADEMKWYGLGANAADEKYAGPTQEGWVDRAAALQKDERVSGAGVGARAAPNAPASELSFLNGLLPPLPPTKMHIEVFPFENAPVAI